MKLGGSGNNQAGFAAFSVAKLVCASPAQSQALARQTLVLAAPPRLHSMQGRLHRYERKMKRERDIESWLRPSRAA